jgi:hypothetical protein
MLLSLPTWAEHDKPRIGPFTRVELPTGVGVNHLTFITAFVQSMQPQRPASRLEFQVNPLNLPI